MITNGRYFLIDIISSATVNTYSKSVIDYEEFIKNGFITVNILQEFD